MLDDELRERLAAWAHPLERVAPPDVSVIRRRARRRTVRRAAGAAGGLAAAAALTVLSLTLARQSSPATRPVPYVSGVTAVAEAPYYIAIEGQGSSAVVHRTASGAVVAAIRPQRGTSFVGVAAAGDDRTFVLAEETGSVIRLYRASLEADGRPGPLEITAVRPVPERSGGCHVRLAGLALAPDGRTLAVSTLSDCASGAGGPGEIEIVSLPSGIVLNTIGAGNLYPLSLSWTADGALAYNVNGPGNVWLIRSAASPGSRPRLLILGSSGLGGFRGPQNPVITPDGSAVIAMLGRGTSFEVAEFSARTGKALRVLVPAVSSPAQYCGPLWTDPSGQHLLAACGDGAESSIDDGHLTRLRSPWQLPSYAIPGGPQIAW